MIHFLLTKCCRMNIHISNLHFNLIESDLQKIFSQFGEVVSVLLIRDKLNNRSKGRAFINMPGSAEGSKAILGLNGTAILGKTVSVAEVNYDPSFSTHLFSEKD